MAFGKSLPGRAAVDLPIRNKSLTEVVVQGSGQVLPPRPKINLQLQGQVPGQVPGRAPGRAPRPGQVRPAAPAGPPRRPPANKVINSTMMLLSAGICSFAVEHGSYEAYWLCMIITGLGSWHNRRM